ncbi:MAG: hypothetical protein IPM64_13810 [Phycisphaerales bacterium]|nr:hypothetical protein [Phycisphaerales bacterium]
MADWLPDGGLSMTIGASGRPSGERGMSPCRADAQPKGDSRKIAAAANVHAAVKVDAAMGERGRERRIIGGS